MVSGQIYYPHILLMFLGVSAVLIFFAARYLKVSNKIMALLTALVFLIAGSYVLFEMHFIEAVSNWEPIMNLFFGKQLHGTIFYVTEPGAKLLILLVLIMGFIVSIYSAEYLRKESRQHTFYPLLLLMVVGLIGMLDAADLLILYLFCELMSVCAYALIAFRRKDNAAIEAGFKYLIMSSVASVIILTGISVLFLANGTINAEAVSQETGWLPLLGSLLILTGFSLKSAIVPLHTWLPDAHGKAPSSISAVLSGVLVQSVFYVMVRINLALGVEPLLLGNILFILSLLNIMVGNLMGIVQENIKRMLGYSTIAQMGYIALCFAVGLRNGSTLALQSGFFIIIAHVFTKSLAFLSAGTFYYYEDVNEVQELRTQTNQMLFTGIVMSFSVLSLSAIPPLPGFMGKWTALTSILAANDPLAVWITLALLIGSLLAFGYYLPLLTSLLGRFQAQKYKSLAQGEKKRISIWMALPMAILAISTLLLIILPQWVLNGTSEAARFLVELMR